MGRWSKMVNRSKLEESYREVGLPSPVDGMRELSDVVASQSDCVNLSIMTDQTPPKGVREVASKSALAGGYIKNYLPLRESICEYYGEHRGAKIDPRNVILTVGGQFALDSVFKILLDEGDSVVTMDPEYATFEPQAAMYGGVVESVPLLLSGGAWSVDLDAFEQRMAACRPKMVILSNCQNPTGYVYRPDVARRLADIVADQKDCWLITDEIWSFLVLEEGLSFTSFTRFTDLYDRMATIFSLSKTFGMSGYRIGALIGPEDLVTETGNMMRFSNQAVPTISQYAATEAIKPEYAPWLDQRIQKLRERTRKAAAKLDSLEGVVCAAPESGCFLFPDISKLGMTSQEFSVQAAKHGVHVIPGYCYGRNSDSYVRISCAVPDNDFYEGIDRLCSFVRTLSK